MDAVVYTFEYYFLADRMTARILNLVRKFNEKNHPPKPDSYRIASAATWKLS
jgi:hypothetical protein